MCDLHNKAILLDLKNGADELARRYNAHAIKWDPDILFTDTEAVENLKALGFVQFLRPRWV